MNNYPLNDRDLSWLSFNKRVLDEASFHDLKVYDRIKFIAIHGSNLDEFARVRLGALEQKVERADKESVAGYLDTLAAARNEVSKQSDAARTVFEKIILPELQASGIKLYHGEDNFSEKHKEEMMHIFMSKVLSYLQPIVITPKTELFLEDRMLYFIVHVDAGRRLTDLKILLNIPSDVLPRFFVLSAVDQLTHVVFLDDIIRVGVPLLFQDFGFKGFFSIKINRNADLNVEDEHEEPENFVEAMQRGLDRRRRGNPSRFQYDNLMPGELVKFCFKQFNLEKEEMLPVGRYLNSSDFSNYLIQKEKL